MSFDGQDRRAPSIRGRGQGGKHPGKAVRGRFPAIRDFHCPLQTGDGARLPLLWLTVNLALCHKPDLDSEPVPDFRFQQTTNLSLAARGAEGNNEPVAELQRAGQSPGLQFSNEG